MKAIKTEVHVIKLELEMSPAEADMLRNIMLDRRKSPVTFIDGNAEAMEVHICEHIIEKIGRVF